MRRGGLYNRLECTDARTGAGGSPPAQVQVQVHTSLRCYALAAQDLIQEYKSVQ
jgi:hypothetical protein